MLSSFLEDKFIYYHALNMKTITISDEVYRKLVSIKGDKTFSQVIDELIMRARNQRIF